MLEQSHQKFNNSMKRIEMDLNNSYFLALIFNGHCIIQLVYISADGVFSELSGEDDLGNFLLIRTSEDYYNIKHRFNLSYLIHGAFRMYVGSIVKWTIRSLE